MIELTLTLLLLVQEEKPAGHSVHGEAFNEGPRQRAYLIPGQGDVHFPVSAKQAETQSFFTQGVAQLHTFYYFEAERSFRQAAQLEPGLAMAYWGMAMANINNEKRAKELIEKAVPLLDKATPREQAWIKSVSAYYKEAKGEKRSRAYVKALEAIIADFPDDLEAKAFLAWAIWFHKDKNLPINSHTAVNALISEVLRGNPMHPGGHHYRIHLWDDEKPARALGAAELYGPSAPGIAHAWHMPGHPYSKLHRYADAALHQEASARVDHLQMLRDSTMPYQIHNYVHNNQWLMQDLGYVGRLRDALAVGDNLIEIPRHPKLNKIDDKSHASREGRSRLFELLTQWELWGELLARETSHLEALAAEEDAAKRLRALGAAAFGSGDFVRGDRCVSELDERLARELAKPEKDDKDGKKREARLKPLRNALAELRGRRASALGEPKAALADLLKSDDLRKDVLARAQLAAGLGDKAEETARAAAKSAEGQALPQAVLAEILFARGKKEDAAAAWKGFRLAARHADAGLPILKRLAPSVKDLAVGLPEEKLAVDKVESLGPLAWHPVTAPAAPPIPGGPSILIFYLGSKCSHCVQQLDAFAKVADEFKALGLPIIAVSTETPELLSKSTSRWPFPLLPDPELKAFKLFRCHDDFERSPLHGTFLIDAARLIRWQDISYEPFTEARFLVEEAKRLLGFRPTPAGW